MRIRVVKPEHSQLDERLKMIHRWLAVRIRKELARKMSNNTQVYEGQLHKGEGSCKD